jgi:glucose/arabinose dehydrogenase
MRRRILLIAAALVVVLAVVGLGAAWYLGKIFTNPSVRNAAPVTVPTGDVAVMAKGLAVPWGIAFLPDRSALVTERDLAKVVSVTPDGKVTEVQTISDVRPGGEGGLLGITVSPGYATDKLVYVYFTAANDNRIARFRLGETPQVIFSGLPKAGIHNGGRIAFGPDGLLYVGTGDATDSGRAQRIDYLGGKILRLTPDGKPAPGNPFPNSPVYSYGHRNVQGLAWDHSGQLYATEFGQNRYDELNRIEPGKNYGWPIVEGMGSDKQYTNPVATWTTSDASPSGLAIVGDRAYLACLRGAKIYRVGLDGQNAQVLLSGQYGRLRAMQAAPDGSLWVSTSNKDGRGNPGPDDDRILRLAPAILSP